MSLLLPLSTKQQSLGETRQVKDHRSSTSGQCRANVADVVPALTRRWVLAVEGPARHMTDTVACDQCLRGGGRSFRAAAPRVPHAPRRRPGLLPQETGLGRREADRGEAVHGGGHRVGQMTGLHARMTAARPAGVCRACVKVINAGMSDYIRSVSKLERNSPQELPSSYVASQQARKPVSQPDSQPVSQFDSHQTMQPVRKQVSQSASQLDIQPVWQASNNAASHKAS